MTWHEDRQVSPGVPDASYVMAGGDYETGWLELKAELPMDKIKFELQPAQHDWISRHHSVVPVHFLCAVGDYWFILDGSKHGLLAEPITVSGLKINSVANFSEADARSRLPLILKDVTARGRNAR